MSYHFIGCPFLLAGLLPTGRQAVPTEGGAGRDPANNAGRGTFRPKTSVFLCFFLTIESSQIIIFFKTINRRKESV